MARPRRRVTLGEVKALEAKIERLDRQLEHQRECRTRQGEEIKFYVNDSTAALLKEGDVVLVMYCPVGLAGTESSAIYVAVEMLEGAEGKRTRKGTALSSYVPTLSGNDFFTFVRKLTK